MRLLILSDSHGRRSYVFDAIDREPTADTVYFLGDGMNEVEEAAEIYGASKRFICVCGNCDRNSLALTRDIRTIGGKRIYASHGFRENVKYGTYMLEDVARENKCDIALFGHTHVPCCEYRDGLYLFNPGSLFDGLYGVVDIVSNGVACVNKKL